MDLKKNSRQGYISYTLSMKWSYTHRQDMVLVHMSAVDCALFRAPGVLLSYA